VPGSFRHRPLLCRSIGEVRVDLYNHLIATLSLRVPAMRILRDMSAMLCPLRLYLFIVAGQRLGSSFISHRRTLLASWSFGRVNTIQPATHHVPHPGGFMLA
jgi:hypothetical protein